MKQRLSILLALSLSLLTACQAGSGEGLDDSGQPIQTGAPVTDAPDDPGGDSENTDPPDQEAPDPGNTGIQPTLESIQENLLTPICAQCHFGSNAPVGLRMDSLEESRKNLIDVNATLNPGFKRIAPGDSDNSFLYLKITGDPVAGNRMPLGLAALPDETIEVIKTWIDNGAPENINVPVVASASLSNPQTSSDAFTITVTFNQPMETRSLTDEQVSITGTASDGTTISAFKTQSLWLTDDTLQVTVDKPGTFNAEFKTIQLQFNQASLSTVLGLSGYELDGDRNGFSGGAVSYEFTL